MRGLSKGRKGGRGRKGRKGRKGRISEIRKGKRFGKSHNKERSVQTS